jgi:hypothetical protein
MTGYCWLICLGDPYDYIVDSVYEVRADAHNYIISLGYEVYGEPEKTLQSYKKKRQQTYFDHAWIELVPFKAGVVK